jgi:hypothetical protein
MLERCLRRGGAILQKGVVQSSAQLGSRYWLAHHEVDSRRKLTGSLYFVAEAGEQNDRHPGVAFLYGGSELLTVQTWHRLIGDYQVELARAKFIESFVSIEGDHRLMTIRPQVFGEQLADDFLVVSYENSAGCSNLGDLFGDRDGHGGGWRERN